MQPLFSAGDVVALKSGGPAMTICATEGGSVHCIWFEGTARHDARFEGILLTPSKPSQPADDEHEQEEFVDNFG